MPGSGTCVSVIVPTYCEAENLPQLAERVDRACRSAGMMYELIVVDDASPDGTGNAVESVASDRIVLLRHPENRGVGAALATGYRHALEHHADVIVVMAGDKQMDPADLPRLLDARLACGVLALDETRDCLVVR